MIEPWVYPALAATAVVSGFVDAVAGGGALIAIPALLLGGVVYLIVRATRPRPRRVGWR